MTWQPIETAPKNKRLLILSHGEVCIGSWAHRFASDKPYLGELTGWLDCDNYELDGATHWMPLPKPPEDV
jgi:hypothetical protein